MASSINDFSKVPTDVLALIAVKVANPSTFSRVCKDFQKAQIAAFRLLKNDYRASKHLQTIAADLLQPSTHEKESSGAFNLQLVKDVYLKVIGHAREAPLGEMIIESTLKIFPRALSVRRLEMIIQFINSKEESPICSMPDHTYYVTGGSCPPPDPFRHLEEEACAIRDMKKDMDKIIGRYTQPKLDPGFLRLVKRKLPEEESISFNRANLRSLENKFLAHFDEQAFAQRMMMKLSGHIEEHQLPEPSYASAVCGNCKSVAQSFLKKLPFF